MPRFSRYALALLSVLPVAAKTTLAHADTYKLFVVTNTQSEHFVMGDDFGDYAFNSSLVFGNTNLCGTSSLNLCYGVGNVFTGAISYSSTLPSPVIDPHPGTATPTRPSGPNWDPLSYLGGLSSGFYSLPGGQMARGIWDGADPVTDYLSDGTIDGGFTSANGNVFFIDGYNNTLVVGIDQQTSPIPEPDTLSLTSTALVAAAALRRRIVRS